MPLDDLNRQGEQVDHLDDLDRQILGILIVDGRASNVDIARKVGSSEATVRRRIQAMIDDAVIEVVAVADPDKIGLETHVMIGINVEFGKAHEVSEHLGSLEPIRYLANTTGRYDLVAHAYFPNNDELYSFLADQLTDISGITDTETTTVLKIVKRTWDFQLMGPVIQRDET
jgi:Lrp/AsnC family transcriptional regulator for asnA, asnC and gidA